MFIFVHPVLFWLRKILRMLILFLGGMLFIMLILSFTSLPFWADYHLGVSSSTLSQDPDVIVIMGGSGMPSQNGLIRCYYGAQAALEFPKARIIIALPGDTLDALSSVRLMGQELIIRGVDSIRIIYENEGTNTRWEALNVKRRFYPNTSPALLVITSPSHMFRSIKTFEKAGFNRVGGMASFGRANEEELNFISQNLGGNQQLPDMGNQINLRYKVWTRMHIQISVIREYLAISYYWLMGWI
jgi:uncharacterized SAM-binding protein YcdF (DUF218 family)